MLYFQIICCLYVPRKEGGRELSNIQDPMNKEQQNIGIRITSQDELVKATKEESVLIDWKGKTGIQHKHRLRQDRKDKLMMKPLYG